MVREAQVGEWTLVIDDALTEPPYAQLVNRITSAIRDGDLAAGAKLPAVRQLASTLGLAANTVAKAYKQLEAEGQVETRGRNGTVVLGQGAHDQITSAVARLVQTAKARGLSLDELVGEIRRSW
ncbi:GntR family transcriptional regulator [Luteococcus sp. H138]|uniref:GntR family transcriptional regulator n=1 Tax=unclassified Luteococcus TaxID=2639923 RepID=UPI00313B17C3